MTVRTRLQKLATHAGVGALAAASATTVVRAAAADDAQSKVDLVGGTGTYGQSAVAHFEHVSSDRRLMLDAGLTVPFVESSFAKSTVGSALFFDKHLMLDEMVQFGFKATKTPDFAQSGVVIGSSNKGGSIGLFVGAGAYDAPGEDPMPSGGLKLVLGGGFELGGKISSALTLGGGLHFDVLTGTHPVASTAANVFLTADVGPVYLKAELSGAERNVRDEDDTIEIASKIGVGLNFDKL